MEIVSIHQILYNIHSFADVTEGGVLGLILLLDHHFGISPSLSGLVLNFVCYAFGFKTLGKEFIAYSALSSVIFSAAYYICELFGPVYPQIADHPLAAAVIGGIFVGVGAGLSVRAGGATGGDDAVAMGITKITGIKISHVYLITDLTVLLLSLTYIPVRRIAFSLLTVIISGQIVGLIQNTKQIRKNS